VTGGWISQADRERWQRDAVRELAAILDAHPGLPLLGWAVGQSGATLAGKASGPAAGIALAAWQQALGLDALAGPGLLPARGRRNGVRITVTAPGTFS
jgi:hypothetical protein